MNSTCFVSIRDTAEFYDMYTEMMNYMNSDANAFIASMKENCIENPEAWNQHLVNDITDIHEELLFYWTTKSFKLSWKDNREKYLYIPFMQWLTSDASFSSLFNSSGNIYEYVMHKHYINSVPLAYMHYQANMRLILAAYTMQQIMMIPDKYKYCPEICNFYGSIDDLISGNTKKILDMAKYRKDCYKNNSIIDLWILNMVCQFMSNGVKYYAKPHCGQCEFTNPGTLDSILEFEKTGLEAILNKTFWFAKDVFSNG
jgi:hypothetical protein